MHWSTFSLAFLITAAAFFGAGVVLLFKPPKSINSLYGYRTARSMKSQKMWDIAQPLSAKYMVRTALLMVLIAIPGLYIPESLPNFYQVMAFVLLLIPISLGMFLLTELKLKKIEEEME